jgi:cell division protein FtsN
MPNPYSSGFYRVQVGAFTSNGLAQQCFARLLSAGFSPAYEPYGNVNRIVLPGIRAADMALIVQRLAAAGFSEVWIREER